MELVQARYPKRMTGVAFSLTSICKANPNISKCQVWCIIHAIANLKKNICIANFTWHQFDRGYAQLKCLLVFTIATLRPLACKLDMMLDLGFLELTVTSYFDAQFQLSCKH